MSEQEKLREALQVELAKAEKRGLERYRIGDMPQVKYWDGFRDAISFALFETNRALLSETPPAGLSVEQPTFMEWFKQSEHYDGMWTLDVLHFAEDAWNAALAAAKPAEPFWETWFCKAHLPVKPHSTGTCFVCNALKLDEQREATLRKDARQEAALELTRMADKLRGEAPEAMGVAWDVVTDWICALNAAPAPAGEAKGGSE